jgi:ubiquinone/menaquinone biosynthesis C-methylase UbiE
MERDFTRRTTFNKVARLYDEMRPGYPEALIEEVISLSGIPPDGRILEVGCGPGQATLPFARRGYRMLCLDIGADLIAVAAEKCRPYPRVEFRVTAFEDWPAEPNALDLVISASAFHWVPPEIGYPKVASVLKPGGAFAILRNEHPRPFTGFHEAVHEVYQRCAPELAETAEKKHRGTSRQEVEDSLRQTGAFGEVTMSQYPWSRQFTADRYLRLLDTYSNHYTLEPEKKRCLYEGIRALIEQFGGTITRPWLSVLYLARKK